MVQMEQQRLAQEHQEAERLLTEQRALIEELESIRYKNERALDLSDLATVAVPGSEFDGHADELSPLNSESRTFSSHCDLPERLVSHYREMLRAYVVMGAGNLADEMTTLASLLADASISARRTMQLHLHVLEELVGALGNRSARHVMNRADLLVLEVMAHLADGYRLRYHDRCHPPRQRTLPGF
jgi:hypothetical protein